MRIVVGIPDDPHCFCYGSAALSPDTVFAIFASTIPNSSFLKIVKANESKRFLHVISERKEDPKGTIEIDVKLLIIESKVGQCTFTLRSSDEQWLQKNMPYRGREIDCVKMVEGSLLQLLISPLSWAESEYRLKRERDKVGINGN